MQQLFLDIGWTRTLKKLEADYKSDMKTAKQFANETMRKLAGGNKAYLESLQGQYDAYYYAYSLEEPGGRDSNPDRSPPAWLVLAAEAAGIEDQREKWDPGFVQKRMDDSYQLVSQEGKRLEFEPLGLRASKTGVKDRWVNEGIYNYTDWETKLGAAMKLSRNLSQYVSPKYRSLVDVKYSSYYNDIAEKVKQHDDYNWYLTKKILTQPNYWTSNVQQLASIGMEIKNRKALSQGLVDLQKLYFDYQAAVDGLDTWGDKYKAIRAQYLKERDAINNRPGMEPMKGGTASKVFASLGRNGRGVDKNYLSHVLAEMKKDNPNIAGLEVFWADRNPWRAGYEERQKRTAWASLAAVAMMYREKMKKTWNESMKAYGITPMSKAGGDYLRNLNNYAIIWGRVCPSFKTQLDELGGPELLNNMLYAGY